MSDIVGVKKTNDELTEQARQFVVDCAASGHSAAAGFTDRVGIQVAVASCGADVLHVIAQMAHQHIENVKAAPA
jgi:hypothetical protein